MSIVSQISPSIYYATLTTIYLLSFIRIVSKSLAFVTKNLNPKKFSTEDWMLRAAVVSGSGSNRAHSRAFSSAAFLASKRLRHSEKSSDAQWRSYLSSCTRSHVSWTW